ncbi:Dnase i-like superfamily protein [Thalictrum thalictroides]|uniref:Dnase i-like superfamily protein n=1 Tax=Thalictrum thalictroides TaxID=46969 RepID=A0A7J6VLS3_THATH|nr:Dnase i-like superfamily protein [Thalictrum thalictroides]
MLGLFSRKIRRLCSKIRLTMGRPKPKVVIRTFGKSNSKTRPREESDNQGSLVYSNGQLNGSNKLERPIRVATFNAAMFSMAPAVPIVEKSIDIDNEDEEYLKIRRSMEIDIRAKSVNDRPKSILKQSPLHPISITSHHEHLSKQQKFQKSKLRVSINLPDNEISLKRSRQLTFVQNEEGSSSNSNSNSTSDCKKGKTPFRSSSLRLPVKTNVIKDSESFRSNRSILEVLKEVDADILALQDVKAEEEKEMKPLSDLATALGMKYVFAESWAPEYGNAVLSKWPIKRSQVQKIFDDTDFRNVLKATIDVPHVGEVNFHCTHLDHLDENWRMKQINAIIQSNDGPHILAGGLNSLDETDYSAERWTDIVKYYEEIGKPTPKVEVVKFLKGKQYTDAKEFAGECESVVMIAKGQNVQGTCKYGTRVDYILASPNSPYKFMPTSYSVLSSKGTSDHHIVKVDIVKVNTPEKVTRRRRKPKKKIVKISNHSSAKGIWRMNT